MIKLSLRHLVHFLGTPVIATYVGMIAYPSIYKSKIAVSTHRPVGQLVAAPRLFEGNLRGTWPNPSYTTSIAVILEFT
jgi:hypothetical protein